MSTQIRSLFFVFFVVLPFSGRASTSEQQYIQLLAEHRIEPRVESLERYFNSLQPDDETRRRVERLVQQLGADRFEDREVATRELLNSAIISHALLVEAARDRDPEIRWRARSILQLADRHSEEVFYAVMFVIEHRRIRGLVGPILSAMPYFDKAHLRDATQRALKVTAEVRDIPTLRAGLSSELPEVRIAAILGLENVAGADAVNHLRPLLADQDERVGLQATRVFANRGDRGCLPVLLALLESEQVSIRSQSISILRRLTGQQFKFVAYGDSTERKLALQAWRDWHDGEGKTAELHFPLNDSREFVGRILVCNYGGNFVTEFDADGNEIWKKENLDHPWGVQALPNHHRLVAACNGRYVVEFDAAGKEVWRKDDLPGNPLSVQRLEDGNTLVATGSAGKVIEIAPDGRIAWEISIPGFMADARRLPNGRTLIANYNTGQVVEVNREGKIVWKIGGFKQTRSAQRLENGNTLVCDNGQNRVVECDHAGNVVWKYEGLATTYDCQRLPDGRTLIGDSTGLRLVDPAGDSAWHRTMTSTGRIFAY